MVLGMDDVKEVKPSPGGILRVMETYHCSKGLYIGDNVTDIQAGKMPVYIQRESNGHRKDIRRWKVFIQI